MWHELKAVGAALYISAVLNGLSSSKIIPALTVLEERVDWTDMSVEGLTVPVGLFVLCFNGN